MPCGRGLEGFHTGKGSCTGRMAVCGSCKPVLTYHCGVQRFLLWERRNNTVMPFNETVQQVFARVSALRDSLDGPQVHPHLCWLHLSAPHLSLQPADLSSSWEHASFLLRPQSPRVCLRSCCC